MYLPTYIGTNIYLISQLSYIGIGWIGWIRLSKDTCGYGALYINNFTDCLFALEYNMTDVNADSLLRSGSF